MEKNEQYKPKVKGHGSFILREGWVNKGLAEVAKEEYSRIFSANKSGNTLATDILGIGSNMVPAMKYWLLCFGLIEEKAGKGVCLSEFGKILYENDSYLEDIFSVWMMHSFMAKNAERASLFHEYFNREDIQIVTREQLIDFFAKIWVAYKIPESSIKSDVDILFNTYCKPKINDDPEDKILSPFNDLLLIRKNGNDYIKAQPDIRLIPDEVILYEIAVCFEEEFANKKNGERSISISKISDGENKLKNIYNLSQIAINQKLNRLEAAGFIKIDRTARLDMVIDRAVPTPMDVIRKYYLQKGGK